MDAILTSSSIIPLDVLFLPKNAPGLALTTPRLLLERQPNEKAIHFTFASHLEICSCLYTSILTNLQSSFPLSATCIFYFFTSNFRDTRFGLISLVSHVVRRNRKRLWPARRRAEGASKEYARAIHTFKSLCLLLTLCAFLQDYVFVDEHNRHRRLKGMDILIHVTLHY